MPPAEPPTVRGTVPTAAAGTPPPQLTTGMEPRPRLSPELTAAFVNGTIVLLMPIALAAAIAVAVTMGPGPIGVDGSTLGRKILVQLLGLMVLLTSASPFAVIAAWRTWVHGGAYRSGQGRGWQGVAEAGALGFLVALFVLRWGIVNRPTDAPPYIVFYGGLATLVGAAIGLILRTVAVTVLKRASRAERQALQARP